MLNVVAGGNETGAALVTHDEVDMISLTGSVETGKWIARTAADSLKRVHLELGGKAPVVVFDDADMEAMAETIAGTGWYNAGQDCTAATRVLAGSKVYDDVLQGLADQSAEYKLGDTTDPETNLGPLSSAVHRERVEGFIQRAPDHARVVTGGKEPDLPGFFFEPTVVGDLRQDDEMVQREIFGPVITVQPFTDEAEAIAWANGTPVRAGVERLDAGHRPRAARVEGAALRVRVDQRPHPARERDAARRLQAVRLRQGPLDVLRRGLHRGQARHGVAQLVRAAVAALALEVAAPTFVIQPTALAPRRRPGLRALGRHVERLAQLLRQALQRQLAVARLRARVLGDRGHARTKTCAYAGFLCVG